MTVLNKHKSGIPDGAVYIGRGTMWGNRYVIGTHGSRAEVCALHKAHLKQQIRDGEVSLQQLASLHRKDLVCFCAPLQCHGDTLELAAAWAVKELEKLLKSDSPEEPGRRGQPRRL